jgi:hypothetical protein
LSRKYSWSKHLSVGALVSELMINGIVSTNDLRPTNGLCRRGSRAAHPRRQMAG